MYTFSVRLCDNEIDRDGERFSLEALEQLKTLFVGKTGIFDHNPKGENQTARLYAAELVQDPERITAAGEVYTFLKGHAYMVRTDANRDLIRENDGGIPDLLRLRRRPQEFPLFPPDRAAVRRQALSCGAGRCDGCL